MPTTATIPEVSAPASDSEAARGCPACPHPAAGHDMIATRFCAATVVGKFSRGCVCPATSSTP